MNTIFEHFSLVNGKVNRAQLLSKKKINYTYPIFLTENKTIILFDPFVNEEDHSGRFLKMPCLGKKLMHDFLTFQ